MAGGSTVYRFGPFELDPPGGRLFRGAARVPLSDSQFAILLQLVSHVGEVRLSLRRPNRTNTPA